MKENRCKKILVILLCIGLLLGAVACDNGGTTETTTTTNPPQIPPVEGATLTSYTEILIAFRSMLAAQITNGMSGLEDYPRPNYSDERAREIGSNLLTLAYNVSPKKMCYANRDLDADGIPELILLSEDYVLSAIFTLRDSKPVLLDIFFDYNHMGTIDKDGYVFKSGYSKGDSWYKSVRILKNGKLELVVEYGCKDSTESGGSLEYYMISADGNRITVEKSEIDAIETMYRPTFSNLAEITFEAIPSIIPFFNLPENSNSPLSLLYREVLCDNLLLYEVLDQYYHIYGNLSDAFSNLTKSTLANARFTMVDMNGDGIRELVLQAPSFETVVVYYEDGVFYAHSITSPDWLWTDGMISYHNVHGYWGSKLQFEGSMRRSEKVYEVIWDDHGNESEFYVGGEAVTKEEFDAYNATAFAEKVMWYDMTAQNIALYVAANDVAPKIDFSTYDAVIESYRIIATMAPICYEAAKDGYEPGSYDKYFDLPDDADQRKIFTALFDAVNARYKTYYYCYDRTELLYAYKDLNGDGIDELLLFTEEYEIMAIFTQKDGKPNLIKYDTLPRSTMWVDADGYIRTHSAGAGGSFTMNVWTIVDGELKFVEGLECGENLSADQVFRYYYLFDAPESSIVFGWREITEEEYNTILAKYAQVSADDLPEYLKANLNLDEHKLFPSAKDPLPSYKWSSTRYPNVSAGKIVTMERLGNSWSLGFAFLPPEDGDTNRYYTAPIRLGEDRFAEACSFATDKISGTVSFGGHVLWLTVESSEFDELPAGVYLFYDNSYYSGK